MNRIDIDVRRIRPTNNMIIVKPFLEAAEKIDLAGIDFWLDTSFEKEKMAATTGEVVSTCKEIFFTMKSGPAMDQKSCRYGTTMEMLPGDMVYYHYLTIQRARDERRLFKANDGEYYMFMHYHDAFCVKRDGKVIMVNGWILLEPVKAVDQFKSKLLEIPNFIKNQDSLKFAKISHVGTYNTGYREYRESFDFTEPIKVGDIVAYEKYSDVMLQYNLYNNLEGKQKFYRMQRKDLCAVMDKDSLEVNG